MKVRLLATLLFLFPALLRCGAQTSAQSPYQQPSARVIRNADGTRLNVRIDPHNQQVEETLEEANKTVVWRVVKELDAALQPKSATKYDGRNNIISLHRYLYLRGRLEEEEVLDSKNHFLAKIVFYYDAKGRMARVEELNAQGVVVSRSQSSGPGASAPSSTRNPSGTTPSR